MTNETAHRNARNACKLMSRVGQEKRFWSVVEEGNGYTSKGFDTIVAAVLFCADHNLQGGAVVDLHDTDGDGVHVVPMRPRTSQDAPCHCDACRGEYSLADCGRG